MAHSPYHLSDGTDISRMTADQIEAERHRAIQADIDYRAHGGIGRTSPRYPSYAEQQERLHKRRETIVARGFLLVFAGSLLYGFVGDWGTAALVGAVGLVGFVATCYYAGARQTNRMNKV